MKAVVFHGYHNVSVDEIEKPTPQKDQVLVKVKACGVCGTDIHIYNGAKGAAECVPPTVLGHEFSGVIESVGAGVTEWEPGDRVAVDPNNACGECSWCLKGKAHFCSNMIGTGTTSDGGFAEYCVVHKRQLSRISDSLSFEEGAMAEPVSCCLHGMDLTDVRQGDNVLIIGGGAIGQIMLRLCVLAGAAQIVLIDHHENKRALAEKSGASFTAATADEVRTLYPDGFDKVIECVGSISSTEEALSLCGNMSTLMIFGLTAPEDAVALKPYEIFKREISIKSSYINPYTIKRAVRLLNTGRLTVGDLITTRLPLAEAVKVFEDAALFKRGKAVIIP